jgi:hypothetical protein
MEGSDARVEARRIDETHGVGCRFARMLRRWTLAALAAAVLSTAAPAQAAPVPALGWGPCGPGLERFLCASADVPTDYDDPGGPTTRLALTKLPASGPRTSAWARCSSIPGVPAGRGWTSSRPPRR